MPAKSAPSRDPRIDAYIDDSAEFARPILARVRETVHEACPDVEETIKWRMPFFQYAGSPLCSMAAFKRHVAFGYWKHALVVGEDGQREGMGSYGKLTSPKDLPPPKTLLAHLKKAAALNEQGVKTVPVRKTGKPKPPLEAPADLLAALKKNRKAQATFDAFAPGCRREYIEWIVGARRDQTRQKRLEQAVEWMAEGKKRNWKYEKC